jgi:hypothetical protein
MVKKLSSCLATLAVAAASVHAEQVDNLLRDAAARIEYGWFAGDESLILAAGQSLAADDSGPWRHYLRAYSAYRLGQLRLDRGQAAGASIDDCYTQSEVAARDPEVEIEALVVQAGCAAIATVTEPLRAVLHQRRLRQALARASELDRDNPRLGLVAMQYLDGTQAGSQPDTDALLLAFRTESERNRFPNWGEPEAMTLIATWRIDAGDVRGARDLVQEALLLAPSYPPALALESRIRDDSRND